MYVSVHRCMCKVYFAECSEYSLPENSLQVCEFVTHNYNTKCPLTKITLEFEQTLLILHVEHAKSQS